MLEKNKTKAVVRSVGAVSVIDIEGDLTPDSRGTVEHAHQEVTSSGSTKVVITFQPDAYINSGGIAIIINVAIAGTKNGQAIRIVQPAEHFQKIFTMVGLRQYVEIFSDESDALTDF
jgi:anti-anti-sigma factor